MKHLLIALGFFAATASVPLYAADRFESAVTADYFTNHSRWDGNGDIYLRWQPVNLEGKLAICGMFSTKGRSHYVAFNKQLLQKAAIEVDGKQVMRGFSYFKTHPNGRRNTAHVGDLSRCKVSRVAFPAPGSNTRMVFNSGAYRIKR